MLMIDNVTQSVFEKTVHEGLRTFNTDWSELKQLLTTVDSQTLRSCLLEAIRFCNDALIELILQSPHMTVDPKNLALHRAIEISANKYIPALLPFSIPTADQCEILELAVLYKNLDAVRQLLPHVDPKCNDSIFVRLAIESGDEDMFDILLPVSDITAENHHALTTAVSHNHENMARKIFATYTHTEQHTLLKILPETPTKIMLKAQWEYRVLQQQCSETQTVSMAKKNRL